MISSLKKTISWALVLLLIFTSSPTAFLTQKGLAHGNPEPQINNKGEKKLKYKAERVNEILEKRQANSRTFRNSDLTETLELYPVDVNYKENKTNKWRKINNDVTEDIKDPEDKTNYKFRNKENSFTTLFGKKGNKTIFKIKKDKNWLSYSLQDAEPVNPSDLNNTITYNDIFPGIEAKYTIRGNGVKEDFKLSKKTNVNKFVYDIKTNLVVQKEENVIKFLDEKSSKVVWEFQEPFIRDSEDKESRDSYYEIKKTNKNNIQLTLVLDREFLDDPETRYPVVIDPPLVVGGTTSTTSDAYVGEYYNNVEYGSDAELRTGYAPSVNSHRSFIKFGTGMPSLSGGLLTSAYFKAYKWYEPNSVDTTINILRVNGSWSENTVNWANQPAFSTIYASKAFPIGSANGWYSWDVSNLANYWYDNPTTYYGLVMQASNENTVGSYRKFYSGDYNSGTYAPKLEINYSPKPVAPTGTPYGLGTNTSKGYVNLSWSSVVGATGYKVSIFNGNNYEDIDVGNVTSFSTKGKNIFPTKEQVAATINPTTVTDWFKISKASEVGTVQDLPDDPSYLYKATGGNYPTNKNYWFRIKAYNTMGETAVSDAYSPTIIDQTAPSKPGKPVVTSKLNSNFTFNWTGSTDSNSGLRGYNVYIGTAAGKADIVNGTFTSTNSFAINTLNPRTRYYVYVKAIDNKGNSTNSDTTAEDARKQTDASITSYSFPSTMEAGIDYNVSVTVKNEGIDSWNSENVFLKSTSSNDSLSTLKSVPLTSTDNILTGQTKTFNIKYQAGKDVGKFNPSWRMSTVSNILFGDSLSTTIDVKDTTPPSGSASILINGSNPDVVNSRDITLQLSVQDNVNTGVTQKIKNENSVWSQEEAFSREKAWTLSEGNGDKVVSVVFKDASGNESTIYNAPIRLDETYPTAKVFTPNMNMYVNGIVTINGVVKDDDLSEFTLSYAKGRTAAEEDFRLIKQGKDIINNGQIASWDTSTLNEGIYTLRLDVKDNAGNTSRQVVYVWVDRAPNLLGSEDSWGLVNTNTGFGTSSVNLISGNLFLQFEDIKLRSRGMDISLVRSFNSKDVDNNILGTGWRINYASSLRKESNGDLTYTDDDGSKFTFTLAEDGTYKTPSGVYYNIESANNKFILNELGRDSLSKEFDLAGKLLRIKDQNNNTVTLTYDGDKLTEVTDPLSRKILLEYDNGQLNQVTAFTGEIVKYYYNNNLLTKVEEYSHDGSLYRQQFYEYDNQSRLISVTDPAGSITKYDYNGLRVTSAKSSLTYTDVRTGVNLKADLNETFNYNLDNNTVLVKKDGKDINQGTLYTWNENGNVISELKDVEGKKVLNSREYENNLLTKEVDGNGKVTYFTYDSLGNLLSKTEPTIHDTNENSITSKTIYEYVSGTNLLETETDQLGRITKYEYDNFGNKITEIDPYGFKTTFKYDSYGNILTETKERGPLFGQVENFSFEEESSSMSKWKSEGDWQYSETEHYSGKRSVKLSKGASITSSFIPIKSGSNYVSGITWLKNAYKDQISLNFYDKDSNLILTNSAESSDSLEWNICHVTAEIPAIAEFVTIEIKAVGSEELLVDNVWTEEANNVTKYTYDIGGLNLLETQDDYGNVTSFEYDTAGNKIKETDSLGRATSRKYNIENLLIESIDREGNKTAYEYDKKDNLTKEIDATGNEKVHQYDELNNLVMTKYPKVTKEIYTSGREYTTETSTIEFINQYNNLNQKIAEKDGNGSVTQYNYDSLGNVIGISDDKGLKVQYGYDSNGNKLTEENTVYNSNTGSYESKGTTYFTYDEQNNLISSSDPVLGKEFQVQKNRYDAIGNNVEIEDGEGNTTTYSFDSYNQPIYSKDSSREEWSIYDGNGDLAITLNENGATYNIYDNNQALRQVIEPDGSTTTNIYDSNGNQTKRIEADGSVTEWKYNAEGLVIEEESQLKDSSSNTSKQAITSYEYNKNGQVIKQVEKEVDSGDEVVGAVETQFTYDEKGAQVKESAKNLITNEITEQRVSLTNNGDVDSTSILDESLKVPVEADLDGDGVYNNETKVVFDTQGRTTNQEISHLNSAAAKTYKEIDNILEINSLTGKTIVQYDNNKRATSIKLPDDSVYMYDYYNNGLIKSLMSPGLKTTFEYGGSTKLENIIVKNSQSDENVLSINYKFNNSGKIFKSSINGKTSSYTFTPRSQLETVETDTIIREYKYDANSNIKSIINNTTGKTIAENTYNTADQLIHRKVYSKDSGDLQFTHDYTYSHSGNIATEVMKNVANGESVKKQYEFNTFDQLINFKKFSNNQLKKDISYEYDNNGKRIAKIVIGETGFKHYHYHLNIDQGIVSEVLVEGQHDADEYDLNYFRDDNNNLLGFVLNDNTYYYQFDIRGSVIAITDSNGKVVTSYEYDEWGMVVDISGDKLIGESNPYRFVGKYDIRYDKDLELYFMGWRDYDPTIGRFVAKDKYEGSADDPISHNSYIYVNSDPINNVDPSGYVFETVIDLISLGHSTYKLVRYPSLANFAYFAWDAGATVIPGAPGSWTVKGAKTLSAFNKARKGAWLLSQTKRGVELEKKLLKGKIPKGFPTNFPTIDTFTRKAGNRYADSITSVKTRDLTAKTYSEKKDGLYNQMVKDINSLKAFTSKSHGGFRVEANKNTKRILIVGFPPVQMTSKQTKQLNDALAYAKSKNVIVKIHFTQ